MKKTYAILTLILLILFVGFTIAVKNINVQAIGPQESSVGFASLNGSVFNLLGTNELCDKLSDICILSAILIAGIFALTGLSQLIKRKSFLKVDFNLYALAAFYISIMIIYALFIFLIINYRPVLDDGLLESSYPSSHVLVTVAIYMTALLQIRERIKNQKLNIILQIGCVVISISVVILKLLSGVHWFTDIIGSVLLASTLISLYRLLYEIIVPLQKK